MPPKTGVIKIKRGGDKNITINHGCGGSDCGGSSNSGDDGGDDGGGGGRESKGGFGCGRADVDGDDEDDDVSFSGGKSDSITTMTGTVAMGLVVAAVAKGTMMTLCQCTRVKHQVAAAVAAVAAVDIEDGLQWWRWWGH